MKEIAFSELGIQPQIGSHNITIQLDDRAVELEVRGYLPIDEKAKLIQFVVDSSIDDATGTFSPLKVEIYYGIALCRWYAGITFSEEDLMNLSTVYDALYTSKIVSTILNTIPLIESSYMRGLVDKIIQDIEHYNCSAAGIIQTMNNNASGLDEQITQILEQIKNGEGLEQLAVIKDVVGKG